MRDKQLAWTFTYHKPPAELNIVLIDTQVYTAQKWEVKDKLTSSKLGAAKLIFVFVCLHCR